MLLVMICIGLILERRFQLLSLRYPRLSATGSGKHTAVEVEVARHKDSFMADGNVRGNTLTERTLAGKDKLTSTTLLSDQRGAVAFEMLIVWSFLMIFLLLPLADVAIAGFRYISAWEALRGFGQYLQNHTPDDVTDASSWKTSVLAKADSRFPIDNGIIKLGCGDAISACTSNDVSPKYYSFTTTVTLSPLSPMLRAALCNNAGSCSFTLSYSEQFQ
jgi:hypothetical protein